MMRTFVQWWMMVSLTAVVLLISACGGGATSPGIGTGGGGAINANAFLGALALACGDPAQTSCNNMLLTVGEGFAPPPPGFLPNAATGATPFFNYTSTQSAVVSAITVTPTAVNDGVAITVNGMAVASGTASPPIGLLPGAQTEIVIIITAANGINQLTYRLTVTRLSPNNADLSALSVSNGAVLSPAFSRDIVAYTSTIPYTAANAGVTVTATTVEQAINPAAIITINGLSVASGAASAPIPIAIGENEIVIVVTALDGVTQKTYRIIVTRLGSPRLSALSLVGQTADPSPLPVEMPLTPAFSTNNVLNEYGSRAENRAVAVVITAVAEAPGAVIKINNVVVDSGMASSPIPLPNTGEGEEQVNTITIVVTHSASGTVDPLIRTYILEVIRQEPPLFEAEAYLKPFDPGADFLSGTSVALSGDGNTAAVGAPGASNGGAVYMYVRQNGVWAAQEPLLRPATVVDGDLFGQSVALSTDGDKLAVGAPARLPGANLNDDPLIGAVYVYSRVNGVWTDPPVMISSFKTAGDDGFGNSVALSGDGLTLAVGAPDDPGGVGGVQNPATVEEDEDAIGSGAVYVYFFNGATWAPQAFIKSPTPTYQGPGKDEEFFGHSVALTENGNLLAVGMPGESSRLSGVNGDTESPNVQDSSGAVRVYTRDAGTWQTASTHFKAQLPRASNRFGMSVALSADGSTLAVGETGHASSSQGIWDTTQDIGVGQFPTAPAANNSGAAYVFSHDMTDDWCQQVFIKASNSRTGYRFGTSLALSADGNELVVGAPGESSAAKTIDGNQLSTGAPGSGAAYAFRRENVEGNESTEVSATPPIDIPPEVPANVTASAGDGQVSVSWNPVCSAVSYNVYMAEESGVSKNNFTTQHTAVSSPDLFTNLTNDVTYYFVVTAVKGLWTQTAYLKAPNSFTNSLSGTSVAVSAAGDLIASGAFGEPSNATGVDNDLPFSADTSIPGRGAAYLFRAVPEPAP